MGGNERQVSFRQTKYLRRKISNLLQLSKTNASEEHLEWNIFDLFITSLFFNSWKTAHTARPKFEQSCLSPIWYPSKNKSFSCSLKQLIFFKDYYKCSSNFNFWPQKVVCRALCSRTKQNIGHPEIGRKFESNLHPQFLRQYVFMCLESYPSTETQFHPVTKNLLGILIIQTFQLGV